MDDRLYTHTHIHVNKQKLTVRAQTNKHSHSPRTNEQEVMFAFVCLFATLTERNMSLYCVSLPPTASRSAEKCAVVASSSAKPVELCTSGGLRARCILLERMMGNGIYIGCNHGL